MPEENRMKTFLEAAGRSGAKTVFCSSPAQAVSYLRDHSGGSILLPSFSSSRRLGLAGLLRDAGCEVIDSDFRRQSAAAAAGLTGVNFAFAETGTLVLESTEEPVRLATTLPERHFALLDPRKIFPDARSAAPVLRQLQSGTRHFVAFVTGPSRTADIERVLTIGVHGPREVHILLLEGLSDDPLEM